MNNAIEKEALGAATPSTVAQSLTNRERTIMNNILPRSKAQVMSEFKHESWRNHAGAYIHSCYQNAKVIARIREPNAGYEQDHQGKRKDGGLNSAWWVCDFNSPYQTTHPIGKDDEGKEQFVEVGHAPIHGWPQGSGMTFDDSEDKKESKFAESRGYTMSIEPMEEPEQDAIAWSQPQAIAMSQLLQVCSARGINPAVFSKEQLFKYISAFMAKTPVAVETPNLTRFK